MTITYATYCLVCKQTMHKVSEIADNKIKFYCPTCDENYWIEQEPILQWDIKVEWKDNTKEND
jgi:transposase-like protein